MSDELTLPTLYISVRPTNTANDPQERLAQAYVRLSAFEVHDYPNQLKEAEDLLNLAQRARGEKNWGDRFAIPMAEALKRKKDLLEVKKALEYEVYEAKVACGQSVSPMPKCSKTLAQWDHELSE